MATDAPKKPWADAPLELISTPVFLTKKHDMFTSGASHMAMVHNSIIRGYNSIYHQALHVSESDKADFVGYCATWHRFLKSHADNEDTGLFPNTEALLEDTGIWKEVDKEHDAFAPGLAKFQEYLSSLKSPSDFSGARLLEIMASFEEPLRIHLQSEVTTIANLSSHPRTPKEGSAEEKKSKDTFDAREGKNLALSGLTDVFPFFLFNFDSDYEDGMWADWPPIPGLVRWTVMSISSGLHPGWWKFASCDAARKKKALYATIVTDI